MRRDTFVRERQERWEELEALVARARRRLGGMSGSQLLRMGDLYLSATSDLAVARRDFPGSPATEYLNGLVARAHPVVYREPVGSWTRIGQWVRYGFPQAYRDAGPYIALSFAAFALGAIISALLVAIYPTAADTLLPGQAQDLRSIMAHHHLWMKANTANHPVAANFIMVNNITVAIEAFAGGMLLGIPAVLIEAYNGISFGTIGAMTGQYGLAEGFWSFVLPHGVIELSVIFMAGGAGIMIGDSILRPGRLRRRDALVRAASHALQLTLGGAALLVVAGTIEGFFSPSDAPDCSKYLVGLVTGILLYSYLLGSRPGIVRRKYTLEELIGEEQPAAGTPVTAAPGL
jgi:uncharacterized membrane protein SpoIIM required for sporulation